MDRTEAFTEYGRILQDTSDWISFGYKMEHENPEVILPRSIPENQPQNPAPPNGAPGNAASENKAPENPSQAVASPPGSDFQTSSLKEIGVEISGCSGCNLYLTRQSTVPGVGVSAATLMIVTPPPSDAAGFDSVPLPPYEYEYLVKWLSALKLDPRQDIFITPAVKCRTPGGRPPHQEESEACAAFLRKQYKEVKPRAILALGDASCASLTGNPADFPSLVGRDWTWGSVPALVLWTPAEVLANPRLRKPVWDSLQRLKAAWNAIPGTQL